MSSGRTVIMNTESRYKYFQTKQQQSPCSCFSWVLTKQQYCKNSNIYTEKSVISLQSFKQNKVTQKFCTETSCHVVQRHCEKDVLLTCRLFFFRQTTTTLIMKVDSETTKDQKTCKHIHQIAKQPSRIHIQYDYQYYTQQQQFISC